VGSRLDLPFLRQVPLFRDLDASTLEALWPRFRERRLRKGEVLFRAGEPGEEMFLIRTGTVIVSKPVTGRVEQVLSRLGAGEVFGEMSLLGDEPRRSATIQAETDVTLVSLDRESLNRFIESSPRDAAKFFQQMLKVAFKRLRDSSDLVAEVTRWGLEATGLDVEHT
jgi:CRP/FNR family transcriptional regulator